MKYDFLEARSENGCENDIFWSEIGSGFGEPGGTPTPIIPRNPDPPPPPSPPPDLKYKHVNHFSCRH